MKKLFTILLFSVLLFSQSKAQTITSAQSGNWNDAATWGGTVPTAANDVIIASGHTVTVSTTSDNQNCNNITVNAGGFLTANGANSPSSAKRQLSVNGTAVINNGTMGNGNDGLCLDLKNTGTTTLSGSDTLKICVIRPNATMDATLEIAGNVQLSYKGAALWIQNGNSAGKNFKNIVVNAGASLVAMAGSNISPASSSGTNIGFVPTIDINGTVKVGGSFIVRCLVGQPIININAGASVSVDNSLTLTTNGGNNNPAIVTVNGSLTTGILGGTTDLSNDSLVISGTGSFTMGDEGTLRIGSSAGLDPVNGQIRTTTRTFSTKANYEYFQSRTGAQVTGPDLPGTIGGLNIRNNATGVVTLSKSVTADTMFTISGGKLKLGANNVVAGKISGGADTAYVVTDGTGYLKVNNVDTASVVFPVGLESSYNPVTIKNKGTIDNFAVGVSSTFTVPVSDLTKMVNRAWKIAADGTGANADLTFQWNSSEAGSAFDPMGSVYVGSLSNLVWNTSAATVANLSTGIYTASATDVTNFTYFSVGNAGFVSVEKEEGLPTEFQLSQNYPNPFNPTTTIKFAIKEASFVSLKVYNVIGEEVANLVNEQMTPGNYNYSFDASKLTSGIYLYRLQAGDFVSTKKMILIK